MLGNNIKVHFANAEQLSNFESALFAGVHYGLFTVFHFICEKFGITGFPCIGVKDHAEMMSILKSQMADQRHTIMDSGLFTLMFGAKAGKRDKAFMERWTEALCDFVLENDIYPTCVDIDCQKVLGVAEAWEFRERMRQRLPGRRIINVFHVEDGKKGLDRLIEYSDYIAIGAPELRIVYGMGKGYEEAMIRYAHYVKNKKPSIDIHLLGCTSKRLLHDLNFCTSADSTSWLSVNRFGQLKVDGKTHHISAIKGDVAADIAQRLEDACYARGFSRLKLASMRYLSRYALAAQCCLRDYTEWAGSQR